MQTLSSPRNDPDLSTAFRAGERGCKLAAWPSARLRRLRSLPIAAAGLLTAVMLLGTAPPERTDDTDTGSLAGQMLIAAPTMGDPRFFHTVILLLRHDRNGAFGIVINRPIEQRSIKSLLEADR